MPRYSIIVRLLLSWAASRPSRGVRSGRSSLYGPDAGHGQIARLLSGDGGGKGTDGEGNGAVGADLLQDLQEPDSGDRAGDRDSSKAVGVGSITRLLPGDDLRRFPRRRAPGQWQPGDPAQLDLSLLQVLARRTAAGFPRKPAREGVLRMIRPKAAPSRLDPLSYESLRQQILNRDGWRCQSCGTMSNLEVHHKQFRSHSGHDSEDNLSTLCSTCHESVHQAPKIWEHSAR